MTATQFITPGVVSAPPNDPEPPPGCAGPPPRGDRQLSTHGGRQARCTKVCSARTLLTRPLRVLWQPGHPPPRRLATVGTP